VSAMIPGLPLLDEFVVAIKEKVAAITYTPSIFLCGMWDCLRHLTLLKDTTRGNGPASKTEREKNIDTIVQR
jgi:hypothetical protein